MSWLIVILLFMTSGVHCLDESNIHNEGFIQRINEVQDSWTAGNNFHRGSYVKNLLSALPLREERLPMRKVEVRDHLPENFDARKNWRRCRSIRRVKDQGNCASAWAIVATGVFSDRLCVSKVSFVEVSAQNVLSCCKYCGFNCFGGYVTDALVFLSKTGAPSNKCHPYEVFACPKVGVLNCGLVRAVSPRCRGYCRSAHKLRPFQDLHRAGGTYSLPNSTLVIMSEIVSQGPLVAVIDIYEDFFNYKSGVYSHTAGRLVGHHPVKVIGWGHEGTPYWLVVNTWSVLWGEKGVVKIARDTSGCNLENRVFALTVN